MLLTTETDEAAQVGDPAFLTRPPVTSTYFLIEHNSSLWPPSPIRQTLECFLTSVSFQTQSPGHLASSFPHFSSSCRLQMTSKELISSDFYKGFKFSFIWPLTKNAFKKIQLILKLHFSLKQSFKVHLSRTNKTFGLLLKILTRSINAIKQVLNALKIN